MSKHNKDMYRIFDDDIEEKKKKKKHHHLRENGYNHEDSQKIADQMEEYLNDISMLVIIMGKKYSKIKEAKKIIKKELIQNLREGKEEKVFDEEAYEKYLRGYYK